MRGLGERRGSLRVAFLAISLSLGAVGPLLGGESKVRLRGAPGMAVRRAIEGASLRLEEPACRQVFLDFSDTAGRPLQAALDQLGETPRATCEASCSSTTARRSGAVRQAASSVVLSRAATSSTSARCSSSRRTSGTRS